jgi:hypothetical protein
MYTNPVCNATIFFSPEDGHIGPKHVVLSESEGEK